MAGKQKAVHEETDPNLENAREVRFKIRAQPTPVRYTRGPRPKDRAVPGSTPLLLDCLAALDLGSKVCFNRSGLTHSLPSILVGMKNSNAGILMVSEKVSGCFPLTINAD